MACASPRRADICARARSSFIKFIFLLRFVGSFISSGVPFLRAVTGGSQRAGEHESGLEGCPLRATRLASGEGEVVALAKSLGRLQTLEVLRPCDRLVCVHDTLR